MTEELFDVIVVGAGPAGLNAALVLGRSRRRVLLLDGGPPRNADAGAAHSVFTRDGTAPLELKQRALADLKRYPVTVREVQAESAQAVGECFEVTLTGGEKIMARRLLLTSGLEDLLPEIPGFREGWGRTVLHCPYCDGWEHRGRRLAVYGGHHPETVDAAHHMALTLRLWSDDVWLLTGEEQAFTAEQRSDFKRVGVRVIADQVRALQAEEPLSVHLSSGQTLDLDAVFYSPQQRQRSPLASVLGCTLTENGRVQVDECGHTSVPGVYAAGDMSGAPQYVMNAAASGVTAGVALNTSLIHAERAAVGAAFHKSE